MLGKKIQLQLITFLNTANLLEPFQSGFTAYYSTESALLKVFNDVLVAVDAGKNAVLILLDLTAALDTVDHNVLIGQLEHLIGIRGTALQ